MNIVITDHIDITPDALAKIKELPARIYDDTPTDETTIIERVKDAEIITANYIDITSAVIDAAPKLKYIVVPAVGYEWIDVKYAASKGIKVVNCPTHNSQAVAEHAIALLFAAARRVCEASGALRSGEWNPARFRGLELQGKQLGLAGYGNIGRRIEKMAAGLGMQVRFVDSKSSPAELDELLSSSDFVVLCLPLTEKTKHLINAERLQLMKPEAILVNVARGAVIDQLALVEALRNSRIAGAGLDVLDGEPLVGASTQEIIDIARLPNVIATPHIGYNTPETAGRLGEEILANLAACMKGTPINRVA